MKYRMSQIIVATIMVVSPLLVILTTLLAKDRVPLTIAAVSMTANTNKTANLERFASYMMEAKAKGAHLVVFPEIALQQNPGWGNAGYQPTVEETAYVRDTAEQIPGESTLWLVQKAREIGLYVVFGMTEIGVDSNLYNSSVFLGPEGILGVHRKHKLWDAATGGNEHLCWKTGSKPGKVVDSPIGKVGLMICIEMAFEFGPALRKAGADLLVTVSAWPDNAGKIYEHVTKLNASKAGCWHVVANQVGSVGHATDYGHSRIIDPGGRLLADTGSVEGMVIEKTTLLIDPAVVIHRQSATN